MNKPALTNRAISLSHRDAARPEPKPFRVFTASKLKAIVTRAGVHGGGTRKVMAFVKGLFS